MSLNSISFANNPIDMGYGDILKQVMQGFNAHLIPQQAQAEVDRSQLENALRQQQLKYGAPRAEAEIANLQRQAQFGGYTGPAQEALSIEMLRRQHGDESPVYQNALRAYQLGQENTRSNIDARGALNTYRGWNSLNQAAKENTLALGRDIAPMMTDQQLANFYAQGGTHEQLGQLVGKSSEQIANAEKKFAATNSTISTIQQGEGALAEEEVMGKFISDAIQPYGRSFLGYSPAQIVDSFKSNPKDIDKQARFLAARALAAEQTAIRARLAGASNASEALKDLKASSLNEFKIFQPLVSPEVYAKTQRYIDEELGKAARARFSVMRGKGVKEAVSSATAKPMASESVTIRNPKTGETLTISREEFERSKRK